MIVCQIGSCNRHKRCMYTPCRGHTHEWSDWSMFVPAPLPCQPATCVPFEPSATPEPLEAYRWRHCDCGAAQSESWAHGVVRYYAPGEQR